MVRSYIDLSVYSLHKHAHFCCHLLYYLHFFSNVLFEFLIFVVARLSASVFYVVFYISRVFIYPSTSSPCEQFFYPDLYSLSSQILKRALFFVENDTVCLNSNDKVIKGKVVGSMDPKCYFPFSKETTTGGKFCIK